MKTTPTRDHDAAIATLRRWAVEHEVQADNHLREDALDLVGVQLGLAWALSYAATRLGMSVGRIERARKKAKRRGR